MDKTMYESKNRILHYEDDDDKDDFTMNVSGGGAVSSFKAGERRELFTTKDKILTANLEYDVENKVCVNITHTLNIYKTAPMY